MQLVKEQSGSFQGLDPQGQGQRQGLGICPQKSLEAGTRTRINITAHNYVWGFRSLGNAAFRQIPPICGQGYSWRSFFLQIRIEMPFAESKLVRIRQITNRKICYKIV